MNYIKHLNKVFELIYEDERVNTFHIALYMSLFQHWNMNLLFRSVSHRPRYRNRMFRWHGRDLQVVGRWHNNGLGSKTRKCKV